MYKMVCDWSQKNATAISAAKKRYDREERGLKHGVT